MSDPVFDAIRENRRLDEAARNGTYRKVRREVGPTGLALWSNLPGTGLTIMWPGPGSRLLLGQCTVPNGAVRHIEHESASDVYNTLKEATAAVEAFVAVLKEAGW